MTEASPAWCSPIILKLFRVRPKGGARSDVSFIPSMKCGGSPTSTHLPSRKTSVWFSPSTICERLESKTSSLICSKIGEDSSWEVISRNSVNQTNFKSSCFSKSGEFHVAPLSKLWNVPINFLNKLTRLDSLSPKYSIFLSGCSYFFLWKLNFALGTDTN